MNMNRKTLRHTACFVAATVTLMTTSVTSFASVPTAGISAIVASTAEIAETAADTSQTTDTTINDIGSKVTAGISSNLLNVVATAEQTAQEELAAAQVEANNAPEVTSIYTDIAIAQVDNYVNVRSTPSEEGEVVGKLYNNSAATVHATEGEWYQITSGNVTGYVKSEYVVTGNEELAKQVSRRTAIVNTETLFVRQEPSTETQVVGMVPNQEVLTVTDDSMSAEGWVKVSIEEGEGYVSTEFVGLSMEFVTAESKEEEEARLAKEEAERVAATEAAAAASAKKNSSSSSQKSVAAPSGSGGSAVASFAGQFVGNPYVYGGTSLTNGADCSGFIMSVYANFGVSLPHSSSALRGVGYEVSQSDMQPGDIICYSGHAAIYVGNNTIVHASTAATGIKYSSPANYKQILSVRRIF